MVTIKSSSELEKMREANAIVRDCLLLMQDKLAAGMTTKQLDKIAFDFIVKSGAKPSFLGYEGYPASICVSIDEEVVHGIPSDDRVIEEGQIVSVDIGAFKNGFNGDAARSIYVGEISEEKKKLISVTRECFFKGIKEIFVGSPLGDVSHAIQQHAESNGYSVVREMVGHGIGRKMHEDPMIPNYGAKGTGLRLKEGMTLAIEPMINLGKKEVCILSNGWTVVTRDGLPSAHYENTIAITENGVEILTL